MQSSTPAPWLSGAAAETPRWGVRAGPQAPLGTVRSSTGGGSCGVPRTPVPPPLPLLSPVRFADTDSDSEDDGEGGAVAEAEAEAEGESREGGSLSDGEDGGEGHGVFVEVADMMKAMANGLLALAPEDPRRVDAALEIAARVYVPEVGGTPGEDDERRCLLRAQFLGARSGVVEAMCDAVPLTGGAPPEGDDFVSLEIMYGVHAIAVTGTEVARRAVAASALPRMARLMKGDSRDAGVRALPQFIHGLVQFVGAAAVPCDDAAAVIRESLRCLGEARQAAEAAAAAGVRYRPQRFSFPALMVNVAMPNKYSLLPLLGVVDALVATLLSADSRAIERDHAAGALALCIYESAQCRDHVLQSGRAEDVANAMAHHPATRPVARLLRPTA